MLSTRKILTERARLTELEADLAYFEARLSLIADIPDSPYQRAQIKAYKELTNNLSRTLRTAKEQYRRSRLADKVRAAS